MATLSETLASAKSSNPYRTTGYPIGIPSMSRDASYGARLSQGPQANNQSLLAALMSGSQPTVQMPSPTFTAPVNFDPILARLSALGQMSIQNARAEAVNLRQRAAIETGDPDLVQSLLPNDPNTIEAARQNEFGGRPVLERDFVNRMRDLNEAANQANLFYGGDRIERLAEMQRGRRGAEQQLLGGTRDVFSSIQSALAAAEEAEIQRELIRRQQQEFMAALAAMFSGGGGSYGTVAPDGGGLITDAGMIASPMPAGYIGANPLPISAAMGMVAPPPPALTPPGWTQNVYNRGMY